MNTIVMEIPQFISEMTEDQIQSRIDEIDNELAEIHRLKKQNRLSLEDIEDVTDNYQYNLEWNYVIDELKDERNQLIQARNSLHIECED